MLMKLSILLVEMPMVTEKPQMALDLLRVNTELCCLIPELKLSNTLLVLRLDMLLK